MIKTKTLQHALMALYGSLGGDCADLTDTESIGYLILAIAKLGLGDKIKTASVKELPDLPDADGTYTLQLVVSEGEATLTWVTLDGFPTAPAEDGTYNLTLTVASGDATRSWESAE